MLAAVLLIIAGSVIVAYPFWPKVEYAISKPAPVIPYQTKLSTGGHITNNVKLGGLPIVQDKPRPADNRLVIPSIGVDMAILEGPTEKTLDRGGIWHIPHTSDPSHGGNTVLSGHRWMYLPPSSRTLYLLDKVQLGEPMIVYWRGAEFDYKVVRREMQVPASIAKNFPAVMHLRLYGMNANGKVYEADAACQIER